MLNGILTAMATISNVMSSFDVPLAKKMYAMAVFCNFVGIR